MTEQMVSVRMPTSLVQELRDLAQENHYLDISEEIRSLLRNAYLEHRSPGKAKLLELKKSLGDITDPTKIMAMKKTLKLLEELNEI